MSPAALPEIAPLADALASAHEADALARALYVRLRDEERQVLAESIRSIYEHDLSSGPPAGVGTVAAALVARLYVEGRGELAEALVALMGDGMVLPRAPSADGPPDLTLDDCVGTPPNRHLMRWFREIAGPLVHPEPLGAALVAVLRHCGHLAARTTAGSSLSTRCGELADAVLVLIAGATSSEPRPKSVVVLAESLADTYEADMLARALYVRLRSERRDVLVGCLMNVWVRLTAGSLVEAGPLGAALVERLRGSGHGEHAEVLAMRLREARLVALPEEPTPPELHGALPSRALLGWLIDASGAAPTRLQLRQLAWSLADRLRADGHEDLARSVMDLFGGDTTFYGDPAAPPTGGTT